MTYAGGTMAAAMPAAPDAFHQARPRLHGIAYRMLGSVAEAEDLVQDLWIRWDATARDAVDNAEAWLVAATTRLAIDRLRSAKIRRHAYEGIWLPEPWLDDDPATPEQTRALADDVSLAFLLLMERLAPEARAAFLLRDVFDADYADIGRILGKSAAACRQTVSRARTTMALTGPRPSVPREAHAAVMRRFAQALSAGDFAGLQDLIADDARLMSDGGGKVKSFPVPLLGARRIAQLFYAAHLRHGAGMRIQLAELNGRTAVLRIIEGVLESAQSYETDGARIVQVLVQRNPDKLARIAAALAGQAAAGREESPGERPRAGQANDAGAGARRTGPPIGRPT